MNKFEHKYVELKSFASQGGGTFVEFLKYLEQAGDEGWELCGFEYGCAFFKRLKVQEGSAWMGPKNIS